MLSIHKQLFIFSHIHARTPHADVYNKREKPAPGEKQGRKVEKGIAFPTCVSLNNCCGHFSPLKEDTVELKNGDVCKMCVVSLPACMFSIRSGYRESFPFSLSCFWLARAIPSCRAVIECGPSPYLCWRTYSRYSETNRSRELCILSRFQKGVVRRRKPTAR